MCRTMCCPKLVSVSDSWDAVLSGGVLIECRVSLQIEEYR